MSEMIADHKLVRALRGTRLITLYWALLAVLAVLVTLLQPGGPW